jgi:biopolymer transport protein ExbD
MRRLRDEYTDHEEEAGELNLVPYMDIVTNIIIFLLASVVSQVPLGNVNVAVPTLAGSAGAASEPQEKNPLNLTVTVSPSGFIIAASGGVIPTLPKLPDGQYDFKALTTKLMEIKAVPENAQETKATFSADAFIPYDIVVQTLDAMRIDAQGKMLFPDVAFAAGIL